MNTSKHTVKSYSTLKLIVKGQLRQVYYGDIPLLFPLVRQGQRVESVFKSLFFADKGERGTEIII